MSCSRARRRRSGGVAGGSGVGVMVSCLVSRRGTWLGTRLVAVVTFGVIGAVAMALQTAGLAAASGDRW